MAHAAPQWFVNSQIAGRFDDIHLLQRGSRFQIFDARETTANRRVAIKVPADDSAAWLHDVLRHEAKVLATIGSHPNIVTLYQHLELDDGRPALLLELCTGSLSDALATGDTMSVQQTVAVGIKLAGALDTMHNAGYLHCDVRPSNILVTEWGEPALSGFDESVLIDSRLGRAPMHVTTTHTAPELLQGEEPTARSDVYGLASTLYELLAGRAAFSEYAGESPAAMVVRVLSGTVKPIFAPDVPLEVSDLLTWAMSPDPTERPPGPSWLAEELRRVERDQDWPRTRMLTG